MKTRTITGLAILTALTIVLQIIANFVQIGEVSITLALIPVAVGAMMYGPFAGAFLGLVAGSMILWAPSTSAFWNTSTVGTLLTCLTKTTIAGFISGCIFKFFYKKHFLLAVVLASLLVPLLNTGVFIGYAFIFFVPVLQAAAKASGSVDWVSFFFLGMILLNFIIEFIINTGLSPALYRLLKSKRFEKYF